jgi:hypothetical protein
MDQDYIEELNHEEKQWLSNFMEEYMSGNTNHEGEALHKTKEELRECYGRNNARNRDIYNHKKANGHLIQADTRILDLYDKEQVDNADNQEDVQIEISDKTNKTND